MARQSVGHLPAVASLASNNSEADKDEVEVPLSRDSATQEQFSKTTVYKEERKRREKGISGTGRESMTVRKEEIERQREGGKGKERGKSG